jgi:alkanesulfonate monooxygenase
MEIYWYLIDNDGRFPFSPAGRRQVTYPYIQQQARALDHLGFAGALLAIGPGGRDQWVTAGSLLSHTERLKFLIACYPNVTSPLLLASQAATLDQFSKGRVAINVVSGDSRAFGANGIFTNHDETYALSDEYWGVWRRIMSGEKVDFDGKYIKVKGAQLNYEPYQTPHPPLFLGGSSQPAMELAAKHVGTYLSWGEPPLASAEKIATVKALAAAQGRKLRYGVRLQLIVRDTKEEAWAEAQKILDSVDSDHIELMRKVRAGSDSVGVQRMNQLVAGKTAKHARDLEIYPDVWAGYALLTKGPGTAIVGDPETVAERLREYLDVGFDTLILSSFPLLEEAYRIAEQVFPLLPFEVDRPKAHSNSRRALQSLVSAS